MKTLFYFILLCLTCLTISCISTDGFYINTTDYVNIIEVSIPDTVNNLQDAQIRAKAMAPNGCWSNLNFVFSKNTGFEYSLIAIGNYETQGTCPEVIVYKDTIINFKPTNTGIYKFFITKTPYDISIDTMIVK